jgi:hypothetical protein
MFPDATILFTITNKYHQKKKWSFDHFYFSITSSILLSETEVIRQS